MIMRLLKRKGTPRPGNGGRRRGAGHPPEFVPNDSRRSLVKMHLAMREYTYAELCEVLINPVTGAPISVDTFARVFSKEIKIAKIEIDTIAMRPSPAKKKPEAQWLLRKYCAMPIAGREGRLG